ncbi:protein zinc induced facilitator-LIKE 1 [Chaetomidium leptoderma]|uniref:Protein zinc induced facilitator-LIKE 1 n=1 Tax=Chaetomidium leptoderma TaxID=669021 RepID=A0AAN6VMX2_9PEZI|nr:protein zinc induced facilitator-LIKE 1 [Chaetomidium leptoderma]
MSSISNIRLQLWVLGLIRATEAIAWTSIFPYTYFMIQSFEVSEHDIAFYSGALIAVFTFGEFLTGVVWARVSDKIGRKPTVLVGIFCGLVTALTLGLSQSVAVAIASRAFGGLFNPNVGLVQTCTGELARIEQRVWTNYPYLLPNLAVGLLQVLTFILAFLVLQETHPRMPGHPVTGLSVLQILKKLFIRRDVTKNATYAPLAEDPAGLEAQENATEEHPLEDFQKKQADGARTSSDSENFRLSRPTDRCLRFSHGTFLALESGGNSDKPADGAAPRGISVAIQPTVIPWFISKFGALRAFRWVLGLYPAMYILTPFLPKIPSPFQFVLLLLDLWMKVAFSSVGYICSAILITSTSPSSQALTRINGAAASFGCLARSVGPLLSGKLFAAGLQSGYLQIPFWTLGAVALVGAVESAFLLDHS